MGWKLRNSLVPLHPYSSSPLKKQAQHVSSSEARGKMMSRGFIAPCYRYIWFIQQQKSQASKCLSKPPTWQGIAFFPAGFLLGITLLAPKSAPHTDKGKPLPQILGTPLPLPSPAKPFPTGAAALLVPCFCPPGGAIPADLLIGTPIFKVIFMDPHIPQR